MGENLLLDDVSEAEIFVGDIVRTGSALLQVSGPRVPCANLARHAGRSDWVKLTINENRTGFYARVLEPGRVCPGDAWELQQRVDETGSITAINRCFYLDLDLDFARRASTLIGFGDWWRQQFREKLAGGPEHWSQAMSR